MWKILELRRSLTWEEIDKVYYTLLQEPEEEGAYDEDDEEGELESEDAPKSIDEPERDELIEAENKDDAQPQYDVETQALIDCMIWPLVFHFKRF